MRLRRWTCERARPRQRSRRALDLVAPSLRSAPHPRREDPPASCDQARPPPPQGESEDGADGSRRSPSPPSWTAPDARPTPRAVWDRAKPASISQRPTRREPKAREVRPGHFVPTTGADRQAAPPRERDSSRGPRNERWMPSRERAPSREHEGEQAKTPADEHRHRAPRPPPPRRDAGERRWDARMERSSERRCDRDAGVGADRTRGRRRLRPRRVAKAVLERGMRRRAIRMHRRGRPATSRSQHRRRAFRSGQRERSHARRGLLLRVSGTPTARSAPRGPQRGKDRTWRRQRCARPVEHGSTVEECKRGRVACGASTHGGSAV